MKICLYASVCVCGSVFLCEQQEKVQIRKELWRIEDVIAGLSSSKANYKVTISSVTNPGEASAIGSMSTKQIAVDLRLYLLIKACSHIFVTNPLNVSHRKLKVLSLQHVCIIVM